jgi:aspartate/tyrosine/aromatic aminotransferase
MCAQHSKRAAGGKFPGHFECIWHDPLAEMLKTPADSLCRRCFSTISRHQVLFIAQLMIREELIDRHLETIDDLVQEMKHSVEKLIKNLEQK